MSPLLYPETSLCLCLRIFRVNYIICVDGGEDQTLSRRQVLRGARRPSAVLSVIATLFGPLQMSLLLLIR